MLLTCQVVHVVPPECYCCLGLTRLPSDFVDLAEPEGREVDISHLVCNAMPLSELNAIEVMSVFQAAS
jgi:hypothetical protein